MRNTLFVTLLFLAGFFVSQAQSRDAYFYGKVVSANKTFHLAHISNLSSGKITITDADYTFKISCSILDTLVISSVGFESKKIIVSASDFNKRNIIVLNAKMYELSGMTISPYGLSGILEVDVKNMAPLKKKNTLKIPGFKTVEELGFPKPRPPNIFQIVDFVYDIFSSRSQQIRKLKEIKESSILDEKLHKKLNRAFISKTFGISDKELDKLLRHCNCDSDFILNASGIEIIDTLSKCYDDFRSK